MGLRTNLWLLLLGLSLIGCNQQDPTKDSLVVLHTQYGNITLVLYEDTPLHKESFLQMAAEGMYDSTTFHRVIKQFMIQGGDVGTKPGLANEARRLIEAEIRPNHLHVRGALAAARRGDNLNPKRKSSTQFYIVQGRTYTPQELTTNLEKLNYAAAQFLQSERNLPLRDSLAQLQLQGKIDDVQAILVDLKDEIAAYTATNLNKEVTPEQLKAYTTVGGVPSLDFEYTVFGQVLDGMEVVDSIAASPTGPGDKPLQDIFVQMEVKTLPKKEITKTYGYRYPATTNQP